MEQPKGGELGTKRNLVIYRLQTSKDTLKSAQILFAAEEYSREIGRKIGEAEEIRHASDYDDFYIASREEAERQIDVASEFIQMAEKYCMSQLENEKING